LEPSEPAFETSAVQNVFVAKEKSNVLAWAHKWSAKLKRWYFCLLNPTQFTEKHPPEMPEVRSTL